MFIWGKVLNNEPSKICKRQPLKNLRGYDLPEVEERLSSTNFTWLILEYFVPYFSLVSQPYSIKCPFFVDNRKTNTWADIGHKINDFLGSYPVSKMTMPTYFSLPLECFD